MTATPYFCVDCRKRISWRAQRCPRCNQLHLRQPLEVRLWSHIEIGVPPAHLPTLGPCWIWTGALRTTGYGVIGVDGHLESAHRVAWTLAIGPVPLGVWVLHRCDNPPCVRPTHLFLGTHQDNMADMRIKGRAGYRSHYGDDHWTHRRPELVKWGESNPSSRLSSAEVAFIKRDLRDGASITSLAREFGVDPRTIDFIKRGEHWGHVQPAKNAKGWTEGELREAWGR